MVGSEIDEMGNIGEAVKDAFKVVEILYEKEGHP